MVVSSACMMVAVMAQIVTMFRRRPGTAIGAAAEFGMASVPAGARSLSRWERVGVRGYGLAFGRNPSPGSQGRSDLSRSKSDISAFDNMRCPTRVNPSWVERWLNSGTPILHSWMRSSSVLLCGRRRREAEQRCERTAMTGVDGGIGAHAGLQLLDVFVVAVEIDPHRHPLHHLDEIAGGVLRRQDRELRAGAGAERTDGALEDVIGKGIDVDGDGLPDRDIGEVRFLRIGVDPGF